MWGVSLGWQAATELGVFATVTIILAWRLPNIIEAVGKFTKIVLKYKIDKKRIPEKAKSKKANLEKKIETKTKGTKV